MAPGQAKDEDTQSGISTYSLHSSSERNDHINEDITHRRHDDDENSNRTDEKLDFLVQAFPGYPRGELLARLQSNEDLPSLVDIILEEQTTNKEVKKPNNKDAGNNEPGVPYLKEMFPEYDCYVLENLLRKTEDNAELAVTYVLQGYVKKTIRGAKRAKDAEDIWTDITPSEIKLSQKGKCDNSAEGHSSSWDEIKEKSIKLHDILDVPVGISLGYLHRSQGDISKALVQIILHEREKAERTDTGSLVMDLTPAGGRVQGSYNKKATFKKLSTIDSRENTYKHDEKSPEAEELGRLYDLSEELQIFNKNFVFRVLEFFKGDMMKTFQVISYLRSRGESNIPPSICRGVPNSCRGNNKLSAASILSKFETPPPTLSLRNEKMSDYRPDKSNSSIFEIKHGLILDRKFSRHNSQSLSKSDPPRVQGTVSPRLSPSRETLLDSPSLSSCECKLDLHNFTVQSAIDVTEHALRTWWERETFQREQDGNLSKFGFAVAYERPLRIITGRGIHSKEGRSRIRVAIKKLLVASPYIFDEHPGEFLVTGKKRVS